MRNLSRSPVRCRLPAASPGTCASALRIILIDLFLEELDTAGHLVKAFYAVLDRDPTRVSDFAENGEDGIVIVQPFADLPVTQVWGIAQSSVRLFQVFQFRLALEIAVRGLHRNDPVFHLLQEFHRILTCQDGIAGIELNAKARGVYLTDYPQIDLAALCKLRITPQAILVMILHAQRDAARLGVLQTLSNAFNRPANAVLERSSRVPLSRKGAAIGGAQLQGKIDCVPLALHLARSLSLVGMGEVGGEAEHRGSEAGAFHRTERLAEFRVISAPEE